MNLRIEKYTHSKANDSSGEERIFYRLVDLSGEISLGEFENKSEANRLLYLLSVPLEIREKIESATQRKSMRKVIAMMNSVSPIVRLDDKSKQSNLVKRALEIVSGYGCSVELVYKSKKEYAASHPYGAYTPETRTIKLNAYDFSEACFLSTLFHELGHHIDYVNGKYLPIYDRQSVLTDDGYGYFVDNYYSLELSADRTGKSLMSKHFPDYAYKSSYDPKPKEYDKNVKERAERRKRIQAREAAKVQNKMEKK